MTSRKLHTLVAGTLGALILAAPAVSVSASDGAHSLTAYPIEILVNGETFCPQAGEVFAVDGVTYAPVRALAEAYGLNVGYNAEKNLVTVDGPPQSETVSKTGAVDFTTQWTVKQKPVTHYGDEHIFTATYSGALSMTEFKDWWKSLDASEIKNGAERLAADAQSMTGGSVTMYFDFVGYALGTAWAYGGFEQSNFTLAQVWIK